MGALIGLMMGVGLLLIWRRPPASTGRPSSRTPNWWTRRGELLRQSGVDGVGSLQLLAAQVVCAVVVGAVVIAVTATITVAVCFAAFAFLLPVLLLRRLRRRRQTSLRELWPEAIDNLASAVRAGLSLPEGVSALSIRGPEALRPPFARFSAAYRASGRFGECLDSLKDDLSDPVGDRVCETLRVAREVGGNDVGTVLRTLSELLRSDARTRAELEARQSWVINAARLAVAAPWFVLLLLSTQSATVSVFDSTGGGLLLAIGAAVCVVAYRMMLRIGQLPEERRVLGEPLVNAALAGGLLGAVAAVGVVLAVRAAPPLRPIRLSDRVAPYLGDTATASKLLGRQSATAVSFIVVRRLFGPVIAESIALIDRTVGGAASVRRRLAGLGRETTVEEFRIEQVVWGGIGLLGGCGLTLVVTKLRGGVNPVLIALGAILGLVIAVLGRDWRLSQQLRVREATMLAEFPVIADLLALAVVAGEAPTDALARVCRLTSGEITRDLGDALARARAGMPLTRSLAELAETTTLEPFSRFLQGLIVAIERGTPLADVLRAQAMDVREAGKRALLEAGGRKEISMMAPVVFMILPVTVLFALYPGLLTLVSLTQ